MHERENEELQKQIDTQKGKNDELQLELDDSENQLQKLNDERTDLQKVVEGKQEMLRNF